MGKFIKLILGIPKTLLFNFYYLPFRRAIKLPIRVSSDVVIGGLGSRASLILDNAADHITIGNGESFALGQKSYWKIDNNARVIFHGRACLGRGVQIVSGGELEFGKNFYCNADCIINAQKRISFGDNCILGWRCTVIDGDGHYIIKNGVRQSKTEAIEIGNHVWLGAEVMVLKGSQIKDDTVVAAKSCVSKKLDSGNLMLVGANKTVASDISWEK